MLDGELQRAARLSRQPQTFFKQPQTLPMSQPGKRAALLSREPQTSLSNRKPYQWATPGTIQVLTVNSCVHRTLLAFPRMLLCLSSA